MYFRGIMYLPILCKMFALSTDADNTDNTDSTENTDNTKYRGGDVTHSTLEMWYERWMIFRDWKRKISRYGDKAAYEISAIRERHSVFALCYHGSDWLKFDNFSKLAEELNVCKKINKRDVPDIIADIKNNIALMRDVSLHSVGGLVGSETVGGSVGSETVGSETVGSETVGSTYSYRTFQPRVHKDFAAEFSKYNAYHVVELLLRYECLCPQGQQWAVPKTWLQKIRTLIGLDLIAFASPINKGVDAPYCSGYSEDITFGSLGSFFKIHPTLLDSYAGRTFTMEINPPFIENVLSSAAISAEAFLRYASEMKNPPKVTILYVAPDWSDADFYRRIVEQMPTIRGVTLRKMKLFAGEYSYENATAGVKVTARQNSWLFTLTNYPADEITLEGFKSIGEITHVATGSASARGGKNRK
jgi:Phosphorylated CTD interacting factor 1 WW domain